jgi:hypothetical protein
LDGAAVRLDRVEAAFLLGAAVQDDPGPAHRAVADPVVLEEPHGVGEGALHLRIVVVDPAWRGDPGAGSKGANNSESSKNISRSASPRPPAEARPSQLACRALGYETGSLEPRARDVLIASRPHVQLETCRGPRYDDPNLITPATDAVAAFLPRS